MIEFEILAMKIKTDKLCAIFLLKNVRSNIIKTILEYLPIPASTTLKRWKAAIILIGQEYESIKRKQDYKTRSEITYRGK